MRRFLMIALTILYQVGISAGFVSDNVPSTDLGTPAEESYAEVQMTSLVPWDMIIFNNKLYLGGGDFGANTGPVDVWCLDLQTHAWEISGTLNDEAIGKFIAIDDRIYAPGFDAKGGTWEYGNYHWLENNVWQTNAALPDALHNFDIVQYEDKLFFAIGTDNGMDSPVKESADDGLTFRDVPFIKDEQSLLEGNQYDYTRVYDFFVTDSGLYCMLLAVTDRTASSYDFYQYKDGAFHFVSDHNQIGLNIKVLKQEPISSKLTYKGNCYIAAGSLSRTADFMSADQIILPNNEWAIDLLVDQERLYVLSAEVKDTVCVVRIYVYIYNSFFYPVAAFESENLPASFAKNGNTFYVGLNRQGYNQDITGSIHQIQVPELTMQLIEACN